MLPSVQLNIMFLVFKNLGQGLFGRRTRAEKPPSEFTPGEHVLLIGNPGAGKSTLLNGLLQDVKFKAGRAADFTSVTKAYSAEKKAGVTFCDLPGLSDDGADKTFAEMFNVKVATRFRIAFVMTMDAGRIREHDIASMLVAIRAISCGKEDEFQPNVVLNKLTGVDMQSETALRIRLVARINKGAL